MEASNPRVANAIRAVSRILRLVSAEFVDGGRPRRGERAARGTTTVWPRTAARCEKSPDGQLTSCACRGPRSTSSPPTHGRGSRRACARKATSAAADGDVSWGVGEFSVSVFHSLDFEAERALLQRLKDWTAEKATKGYHAITWPEEHGGLGLSPRATHAPSASSRRSSRRPTSHETHSVTTRLIAPTINLYGTDVQRKELVGNFLAARELCCQLFSEPGAGSDLASLACRAELDGDEWVDQRSEGLELGRAVLRVGRADRAPRPRRAEAQGDDGVRHPARPPRHRGATDQADERRVVVQRGLLHRRAGPRHDAARSRRRRAGRSR